jgi:4-hydroxybenzoate polyprenyltransferase
MASVPQPTTPLSRARTYASFVRFEHTLFSLPLILAGVFSAPGPALSPMRWGLLLIAAVGARTAAMAINRLVDRRLDSLNPRTRERELPSGKMKLFEAWALLVVSIAAYVAACAALGPWFLRVSPVPLLVFTLYPYLKRFTAFCHFGVGAALALAPLAGYAAAHPDLAHPAVALWLAAFALVWVAGFDIIYATLDEDFDRANGVHSMVAWLGRQRALRVSAMLHNLASYLLIPIAILLVGPLNGKSLPLIIAPFLLCVVTNFLLRLEQKWAEDVNLAFFKVNVWVGFAVLAIVLLGRLAGGGF